MDKRHYARPFCNETPSECHFEIKSYAAGTTVHHDDIEINYLIYCQSGHARISSTLFHDEILCEGEIMFVPRQSECTGTALSDVTLLVHKFNNTVCCSEKCMLAYLYTHRHIDSKQIKYMGEFLVNASIFYTFVLTSKERYNGQICYATNRNKQNTPRCKSVSTSP